MNFLFITCFLLIYSLFLAMIRSLIISDPYHPHLPSLFSREGKRLEMELMMDHASVMKPL